MKWFKVLLPVLLVVGMLLGGGSLVYADEGEDSDLDVDIVIVGDNPDVEVDIYGDNPDVWINGQNLNEPTVIRRTTDRGGESKGWIRKEIGRAVEPLYSWLNSVGPTVSLTVDGLAKVILTITDQESQLSEALGKIAELESEIAQLDSHKDRLTSLSEKVESLNAQDAFTRAYVEDYANYLKADYNSKLMTIVVLFSVVVIGLTVGLVIVGVRSRKNT